MKKWIYSGTREEQPSERELMHGKLAKKAASEGIVLLKNEGILPLKKDTAAALLGYGAEKTVKGGIGSGDVNNRKNISIYQGLKEAGVKIVSEDWISDYHNRYEQAREAWKEKVLEEAKKVDNPFDAYADNPFEMPLGREVREEDICQAEAIIYVISRISGIIADEMAIGMINQKTTAVRLIPVIGKDVGDTAEFGGLLGYAPIIPVNEYDCSAFVSRKGRIPAPVHSFKN